MLDNSTSNQGVLSIPQNSSITRTSPSDCLMSYPGHCLKRSYPSVEKQSVYFTAPADWTTKTPVEEVLPLCRVAVSVFYSPSRLDHQDTRWGGLAPLQRSSQCILPPQPTWPPRHPLGMSYSSAETQSVYFTAPADLTTKTSVGEVLPLCREAVRVF